MINYRDFEMMKNIIKDFYKECYHCIEEDNSLEVNLNFKQEKELIERQDDLFRTIEKDDATTNKISFTIFISVYTGIIGIFLDKLIFTPILDVPSESLKFILYIGNVILIFILLIIIYTPVIISVAKKNSISKYEMELLKYEMEIIEKILKEGSKLFNKKNNFI